MICSSIATEMVLAKSRVEEIDKIMNRLHPDFDEWAWNHLLRRRHDWLAYHDALQSAENLRPTLPMRWDGSVEI